MTDRLVLKDDVQAALQGAGVKSEMNLMVHCSLSSFGYVVGGAQTIIEALIDAEGPAGTLMMPTQSWKNLDPETGVHPEVPPLAWQIIRDKWPAYDPAITPTNTMGAVAELFRRWPGAVRSAHPARSVTALGKNAETLTQDHDLSNIFGDGSPLSRLYDLDGYVLLMGVGHDKNTSLHLADARAEYPGKHLVTEHSAIMEDGRRVWKAYETLAVDGSDFEEVGRAFEMVHAVGRSYAGNALFRLMSQRNLVDFAVWWIERHRTNDTD